MRHTHDAIGCPCQGWSVSLALDSAIQIMGHKFKLPLGIHTAAKIAEAVEIESGPIGIHCSASDDKVSIDVKEFMKAPEVSVIFGIKIERVAE